MARDSDPVIEAEVIEIDGKVPLPPDPNARTSRSLRRDAEADDEAPTGNTWPSWQRWPGQVRTLHPLWWPVLIVAGIILLSLLIVLGLCAAVVVVIFRILRALFR
jgi:hypothetical protein